MIACHVSCHVSIHLNAGTSHVASAARSSRRWRPSSGRLGGNSTRSHAATDARQAKWSRNLQMRVFPSAGSMIRSPRHKGIYAAKLHPNGREDLRVDVCLSAATYPWIESGATLLLRYEFHLQPREELQDLAGETLRLLWDPIRDPTSVRSPCDLRVARRRTDDGARL